MKSLIHQYKRHIKAMSLKLFTLLLICTTTGSIAQMSGNYTVGGVSPNFLSIQQAINALMSKGVNGPTNILIRNGNYPMQLSMGYIPGADSVNRVIFQSENKDTALVEISYAAAGFSDNWVLQFDSTQYVTFKWLTLKATGNKSSYTTVIEYKSHSNHTHIEECMIVGQKYHTGGMIYAAQGSYYNDVHISNNHFYLGGMGVNMRNDGNTTYPNGQRVVVENNFFEEQMGGAITLINQDYFEAKNNRVSSMLNPGGFDCFYFGNVDKGGIVANNQIVITGRTGIGLNNCGNPASAPGKLFNNFVSVTGKNCVGLAIRAAFSAAKTTYWNVYNNTVIVDGSSWGTGLNFLYAENNHIYNNILYNNNLGGVIYNLDSTTLLNNAIDFNVLYSKDSIQEVWNGVNYLNLSAFQAASSTNSNSIQTDPNFSSITDYHLCNALIDGAGTSLYSSAKDLDGDIRNATNPDIGLDEFNTSIDTSVTINGNMISSNQNGATYQWLDCNNGYAVISGANNQAYTGTIGGSYAVEITTGMCVDTSSCYSVWTTNVENTRATLSSLQVFPNPTSGTFFLDATNFPDLQYMVSTLEGKVIQRSKVSSGRIIAIDISDEPEGIYILQLNSGNEHQYHKIVKY